MRSYHKVYSRTDATGISWVSANPDSTVDPAPLYMQIVLRSRKIDWINGYNYLGSVGFAQLGGPFQAHWICRDSNGLDFLTFSGQQLAGLIFPLRNYASHPAN
jgi:hypothetical protein